MTSIQVKGIALKEKKIMIYDIKNNKDIETYCEKGYGTISHQKYNEYKRKPRTSPYMLVNMCKEAKTMQAYYEEFIEIAEELKKESAGKINMFKTGTYTNTSLKLLADFHETKKIMFDTIEEYEARFISKCGGAFRLAVPYKGKLFKKDIRSFYPSIYSSSTLLIPVKKGILMTITQDEFNNTEIKKYGVYRAQIEKPTGNLKKLFWINPDNYYTHNEIRYAIEHGLKVTIINEKDNFLHWPRDHCRTGSEIFGDFVKYLYEMKERGVRGAKLLLNCLWGICVKRNYKILTHDLRDGEFDLFSGEVVETDMLDDNHIQLKISYSTNQFKTQLARMKPFLLAKCRLTMAKTIEPVIEHVKYSHTDSIISSIELQLKDNGKIGSWKDEGYCEGEVINMNRVIGFRTYITNENDEEDD